MAKKCMLTGKKPMFGNSVSHAHNKTKRRQNPNLQWKRYFIPSQNRWVRLRLSTRAIRIIDLKGIEAVLPELKKNGAL